MNIQQRIHVVIPSFTARQIKKKKKKITQNRNKTEMSNLLKFTVIIDSVNCKPSNVTCEDIMTNGLNVQKAESRRHPLTGLLQIKPFCCCKYSKSKIPKHKRRNERRRREQNI